MTIKLVNRGTECELLMDGRLDATTSEEVWESLQQICDRFSRVILNMAKLQYISSAGLRVMKLTHMAMRKKNGELVLTNVNPMVMEVFEMTGFSGLLQFE